MPADFEKCRREGGRMRTISGPSKEHGLKAGEYIHVCFDRKGGMHRGEKKMKDVESKRGR